MQIPATTRCSAEFSKATRRLVLAHLSAVDRKPTALTTNCLVRVCASACQAGARATSLRRSERVGHRWSDCHHRFQLVQCQEDERHLSKLVHLRAGQKPISDARTATYVILTIGSGPGGRRFKSFRPTTFSTVRSDSPFTKRSGDMVYRCLARFNPHLVLISRRATRLRLKHGRRACAGGASREIGLGFESFRSEAFQCALNLVGKVLDVCMGLLSFQGKQES